MNIHSKVIEGGRFSVAGRHLTYPEAFKYNGQEISLHLYYDYDLSKFCGFRVDDNGNRELWCEIRHEPTGVGAFYDH